MAQTTNQNIKKQSNNEDQLLDVLFLYISKWRWVLFSVIAALMIGLLYLLTVSPLYVAKSSILLKSDRDGQSILDNMAMSMADIGMSRTNINTTNVIMTFQTPDIIHEVIQRLHLNDTYKTRLTFRKALLYGTTLPYRVEFIDSPYSGKGSFEMQQNDRGEVTFSKFTVMVDRDEVKYQEEYVANMGDTIETPLGRMRAVENPDYLRPDGAEEYYTKSILVSHTSSFDAIEGFQKNFSVKLREKMGTVFDLSFTDPSRERGIDILNMATSVYDEFWMKDKNKVTVNTVEFITQRLELLKADLKSVDNEIADYKSTQRIPSIEATAQYNLSLAGENERKLQMLSNDLSIARFLMTYMKSNNDKLLPANLGVSDQSIQTQINEYNRLSLQRSRLVESSSEENNLVKNIDIQLESLRNGIAASVDNYVESLQIQLKSYENDRQNINARITSNPKQAGHLLSSEREQKVKEGLYLFLLEKKEEMEISQAFTAYDTRVIMYPELGSSLLPASPNKRKVLMLAFALGLIVPFGVLYVLELMNTKVKGKKDFENISIPFVGEIPLASQQNRIRFLERFRKPKETRVVDLVVKPESRDVVNEAFRMVRTNIEYMIGDQETGKGTVIMTTAANINSGKTFISCNLSKSLGIIGKRVVAVDLDLRKATLSHTFECDTQEGVSTFLNGRKKSVKELIHHQDIDILPAGALPPNPAELLVGDKLKEMIETLRELYDYIILDCPPVEIVSDADIVRKWADMTLFVVRANLFNKALLPDLEKYYETNHFNHLSIVLNGTEAIGRYGYKYGYYKNGYGYGYGRYGYYQ